MTTTSLPAARLDFAGVFAARTDAAAAVQIGQVGVQEIVLSEFKHGGGGALHPRLTAPVPRHLLTCFSARAPRTRCTKCETVRGSRQDGRPATPLESAQGETRVPQVGEDKDPASTPAATFWNPISWLVEYADAHRSENIFSRRAYFYPEDWAKHRSSARHWRHLMSINSSRVIRSLAAPVTSFGVISSLISVYNYTVMDGLRLPPYFPLLRVPSLPYELIAPALALLLVFRTEASYSRYDEARKTWTKVIGSTKDMARQSQAWIGDAKAKAALLRYTLAFPAALRCHLLYSACIKVEDNLKELVKADELAVIMSANHRPNCILQFMTQTLRRVDLRDAEMNQLQSHLVKFNESISVCERLMRTPIPLSYTRLTSRFLVLWHLALPLTLWDQCEWLVVPATIFSAAILFCIEEVGVIIEEPFPLLALDKIVAAAHIHILELVELQTIVDNHLKNQGELSTSSASNGSAKT